MEATHENHSIEPQLIREVALYRQKRNYTCGPSSVMMVMSALNPAFLPNEVDELEIWREATTIHGGCGPVGLALALNRRGFAAHAMVSHDGAFLESRAARIDQKEAMRILQQRDLAEANQRGIDVLVGNYTLADIERWVSHGWYPIVMIGIEFEGNNITHWVVITGFDGGRLLINDPLRDPAAADDTWRIDAAEFDRISKFGPDAERAVVLAGRPPTADASGFPFRPAHSMVWSQPA